MLADGVELRASDGLELRGPDVLEMRASGAEAVTAEHVMALESKVVEQRAWGLKAWGEIQRLNRLRCVCVWRVCIA